jgi:hypothetical protein
LADFFKDQPDDSYLLIKSPYSYNLKIFRLPEEKNESDAEEAPEVI